MPVKLLHGVDWVHRDEIVVYLQGSHTRVGNTSFTASVPLRFLKATNPDGTPPYEECVSEVSNTTLLCASMRAVELASPKRVSSPRMEHQ